MIPVVLFVMMGLVGVSFSPLGRAVGRRLGGSEPGERHDIERLSDEVAELRQHVEDLESRLGGELGEVHNRLDFAERVLAQQKGREALPGGR